MTRSVAVAAVLLLAGVACAHTRPAAPAQPRISPPKVEATLDHFPPAVGPYQPVTLTGRLHDPGRVAACPAVTFTWPDGTRSGRAFDCDADEIALEYVVTVQIAALPPGRWPFAIAFESGGHEWSAQHVVEVAGQ